MFLLMKFMVTNHPDDDNYNNNNEGSKFNNTNYQQLCKAKLLLII